MDRNQCGNWHTSVGFWISDSLQADWGLDVGFMWIDRGCTSRYLGCQVGIDISPAQQFTPVFMSIKGKLQHWGSRKLDLASRALVINECCWPLLGLSLLVGFFIRDALASYATSFGIFYGQD